MAIRYDVGTYKAIVTGQAFSENEYGLSFNISLRPADGEQDRTVYLSLTDKDGNKAEYYEKTLAVLAHLGFPGPNFSELDPENPNHFTLVGKDVVAYCAHKNDKERWYINTPRAGNSQPADAKSVRQLDSLFGKDYKELLREQGAGQPAAPAAQPTAPEPTPAPAQPATDTPPKSDIPF